MILFLHLLLGALVSFVASIPLGPVNLTIIQAALNSHRSTATNIALGSATVELFYCVLAVLGLQLYEPDEHVVLWIQLFSVPILATVGIYNLRKHAVAQPKSEPTERKRGSFWIGVSLNFLNPLLLPFWLFITNWLNANHWMRSGTRFGIAFSLGVAVGTFLLLMAMAEVSRRRRQALSAESLQLANRIIGWLFVGFAAYTAYTATVALFKVYPGLLS